VVIKVAGQIFGQEEIENVRQVVESGAWAEGKWANEFSKALQECIGTRCTILCNSGSSANLLAISALTSHKLGSKRLLRGDFVAVPAVSFPTTIAPIIQNRLVPIYLDSELSTANPSVESIEQAIVDGKARAVVATHTLGNPLDVEAIQQLCHQHGVWFIEDNCDALGSEWNGRRTGCFGVMSTQSFYPAHHISCGEGGAVNANPLFEKILESFRNWGRDCWCEPGKDNTCGKRFEHALGQLPYGYDHKYTFTHLGYNLKMTDLQAALGVAQMKRLPGFIEKRRINHAYLYTNLREFEGEQLLFQHSLPLAKASWFGFLMTVNTKRFTRAQIVGYLESNGVMTRALFAGNASKQPAFVQYGGSRLGKLPNADRIMNDSFWVGCWPGLTTADLDKMIDLIRDYVRLT
jgi:CDP-6-deoxy-D-xylo-4-hexulose-3-dehydrase